MLQARIQGMLLDLFTIDCIDCEMVQVLWRKKFDHQAPKPRRKWIPVGPCRETGIIRN